jgi:hypothetical protein
MDPALMNYLQSQQANQQQNPQGNTAAYNPFDAGISRAISSAQESLGMTEKQQDKALRRSMLTFANNIAQQPKQRGFFNNFGAAARSMNPAIMDYDNAEDQYLAQNNNMANQILGYQAANRKEQNALEHQDWMRKHSENQLAEQRRYHDIAADLQRQRLDMHQQAQMKPTSHGNSGGSSDLLDLLDQAERVLMDDEIKQNPETYRGRANAFFSKFIPGGYIPTEPQAEINALGDVLKGQLFNKWNYRNRAEFEHVPTISADNPPEVNLQIIRTLKKQFGGTPLNKSSPPLNINKVSAPLNNQVSAAPQNPMDVLEEYAE